MNNESFDRLLINYEWNDTVPTIFFYRGPIKSFENFTEEIRNKLEKNTKILEIILSQNDALERVKSESRYGDIIKIINFEKYSEPHTLCKSLKEINHRVLVGIYVNPKKSWSNKIPYSFSNHYDQFIEF